MWIILVKPKGTAIFHKIDNIFHWKGVKYFQYLFNITAIGNVEGDGLYDFLSSWVLKF